MKLIIRMLPRLRSGSIETRNERDIVHQKDKEFIDYASNRSSSGVHWSSSGVEMTSFPKNSPEAAMTGRHLMKGTLP
jgi:hypothetical protein